MSHGTGSNWTPDAAAAAATADLATTSKDAEALGGQPADHYMTADSVLGSGQTEAGDYIAAAGNGQAGTVLVQLPHLPESLPEGHIVSGVMTWRSNQSNGLLRGTWAYTAP